RRAAGVSRMFPGGHELDEAQLNAAAQEFGVVRDQFLRYRRQLLPRVRDIEAQETQRLKEPIEVRVQLVKALVKGPKLLGDRGSPDEAGIVDFEMGLRGGEQAAIQVDEWFRHE